MKEYKNVYLQNLPEDEFNVGSKIGQSMTGLGYVMFEKNRPDDPGATDLLVKYSYFDSWDLNKYLKSFQVKFIDARSDKVVATIDYHKNGIWGGSDGRVPDAFNYCRPYFGWPEIIE